MQNSEGIHIRKTTVRKRMRAREYVIWCDESDKEGKHYCNFYGGVLVRSTDLKEVQQSIGKICRTLHFRDEIKWQKVSEHYLDKYIQVMDVFFDLVAADKVKIRIMFRQKAFVARHLSEQHVRDEYFILYYLFIRHAFGLAHSNSFAEPLYLRLYFDLLPDTLAKRQIFKEYIKSLQVKREFQQANIKIRKQDITEVDSRRHRVLQMLDVVLGAMCFRLNNKHKALLPGQRRRGNRTKAKEKLYKHILKRIREIYPGFNIGVNTAAGELQDRWQHSYRHWNFRPRDHEIDETHFK